jgi:hypothetical protein
MDGERSAEQVDREVATAFGLYALSNRSIHEAASEAGITRWELERAIEQAGLAETFELHTDGDISATIDELLDGE